MSDPKTDKTLEDEGRDATAEQKAWDELARLTSGIGPAANWRWSIPANPDRDSDLILAAGLKALADEREVLQQRIDAAGKMLLAIVDGLSCVDTKTDPVAIASTTLDEIKTIRNTLTTESKEPEQQFDPKPWIYDKTGWRTDSDWFNTQVPGILRFAPRPEFSQNPADYGIEAPHE